MADYYSYLTCAARTDQGRKRKNNEDAYGVFLQHGVFCVADGMGGAEDGEVASQAAVEAVSTMLKRFNPERPLALKAMSAWLSLAVNEASAWIFKRSEERGCRGTGSTFVGVCCDPEKPGVMLSLHAGDSRLYRIRNEEIRQITGDHSAAALAGVKDEKELNPMFRGMVMRAVGVQTAVELERTSFDVKEGDVVLLCSDGLTRMVNDEAICDSVRKAASLDVAVQTLIDAANENGGVDNVTVILIKVGTLPSSIPAVINECPAVCVNEPREKEETNTAGTSDSQEHTDSTQNLGKGPVTPDTPPTGSSHTAETADEKAPAHPEMFEGTRAEGFGRRTVPMGGSAPAEKALWKRLLTVMAAVAAAGLCLFVVVWQAGWLVAKRDPVSQAEITPPQKKKAETDRSVEEKAARDKAAQMAAAAKAEAEEAAERAKAERLAAEKAALDKEAQIVAEAAVQAEANRAAREKLIAAKLAEKKAAKKKAAAKAEAERVTREAAEKAQAERLAAEKAALDKAARAAAEAAAKAEAERVAREAAEKTRAERLAAEKAARDKAAQAAAETVVPVAVVRAANKQQNGGMEHGDPICRLVDLARDKATLEEFVAILSDYEDGKAIEFRNGLLESSRQLVALADAKTVQTGHPVSSALLSTQADRLIVQRFVGALANVAASIQFSADEWNAKVQMLERNPLCADEAKNAKETYETWQGFIDVCSGSKVLTDSTTQLALVALARESSNKIKTLRNLWERTSASRK